MDEINDDELFLIVGGVLGAVDRIEVWCLLYIKDKNRGCDMPAIMKCEVCGFKGNHGFDMVNGGMCFYHFGENGIHRFYIGDNGRVYKTELELFLNVTMPRALRDGRDSGVKSWCAGRIEQLKGHPRKAERYMKEWKRINDCA